LFVSDAEVREAISFAWREHQLIVEPGGSVALAALLAGKVEPIEETVAVVSGGNVDPELHARIVNDDCELVPLRRRSPVRCDSSAYALVWAPAFAGEPTTSLQFK
jgi:threonine dehydratase